MNRQVQLPLLDSFLRFLASFAIVIACALGILIILAGFLGLIIHRMS